MKNQVKKAAFILSVFLFFPFMLTPVIFPGFLENNGAAFLLYIFCMLSLCFVSAITRESVK